jgi:acetyl esterase/lipase
MSDRRDGFRAFRLRRSPCSRGAPGDSYVPAGLAKRRSATAGVAGLAALVVAAAAACAHGVEPGQPELAAAPIASVAAPQPLTLPLWPGSEPGRGRPLERPADPVRGAIARITDVTEPTLTLYRPPRANTAGPAILVLPGGGYQHLSVDIEGEEVCRWLTEAGVTCVVVTYRVPQPPDSARHLQPLQDVQRALGLVRRNAREWGVDPRRVGVLGFSAGAHVAAVLGAHADVRAYAPVDEADSESGRPDFSLLLYPAYLVRERGGSRLAAEVRPGPASPPTFLVQTADDPVGVENSVHYALALHEAGVPAELHVYAEGGHGYGLRAAVGEVARTWPRLALRWLIAREVLRDTTVPELP